MCDKKESALRHLLAWPPGWKIGAIPEGRGRPGVRTRSITNDTHSVGTLFKASFCGGGFAHTSPDNLTERTDRRIFGESILQVPLQVI